MGVRVSDDSGVESQYTEMGVLMVRPAYIAGVTNPIFESSGSWDLLFDVSNGRVIVSKDINSTFPPSSASGHLGVTPINSRSGILKAEGSLGNEDDVGRAPGKEGRDAGQKSDFVARTDSPDNLFMEDVGAPPILSVFTV